MSKTSARYFAVGLAVFLCVRAMAPEAALAQMSEQQLRAGIEKTYNVRVLKMRQGDMDGRRAYFATVMNPGGAFNEAFQVSTIAIDAATGKLISGFRHRSSGLVENQSPSYRTGRQSADSFRQGFSWR